MAMSDVVPTGSTPNAKRPLDPSTIPVASGADRLLNQADLSAGFANLVALQERDFKALMSTADASHYNAQLLNAVVGRLNTLEAAMVLTTSAVGTLTEDAKATIQQLADHEAKADANLREQLVKTDRALRDELNVMTQKLEAKLAEMSATPAPIGATPASPARWGRVAVELEALKANTDHLAGKLRDLDGFTTNLVREQQGAVNALQNVSHAQAAQITGLEQAVGGILASASRAQTSAPAPGSDPLAGNDAWQTTRDASGLFDHRARAGDQGRMFGSAPAAAHTFPISTPVGPPGAHPPPMPAQHGESGHAGRNSKWYLYDEKYVMIPAVSHNKYDSKKAQEWLQTTRDYVAGRTSEMDPLLDWVERQEEPITDEALTSQGNVPMHDESLSLKEVSRQLWAMLQKLVVDTSVASAFANVPRHNGLEAWRILANPINEDKAILQKDLMVKVSHPKGASNMDGVEQAVIDWDTSIRLFTAAGGVAPPDSSKRLTFIDMIPPDISSYVLMHMEMYPSYDSLRKFVMKYVRVQKSIKGRQARPAHLVDRADIHDETVDRWVRGFERRR